MKKPIYQLLFTVFCVSMLLSSCEEEANPLIGDWKMKKLEIADNPPIFDNTLRTMIRFKDDGTYVITTAGEPEKGKWRKEKDVLYMAKETTNFEEVAFTIDSLSESIMVYKSDGVQESTVTLIKINEDDGHHGDHDH